MNSQVSKYAFKNFIILLVVTIIFSVFSLQLAKEKKDFIYVVPKIKNFEVLNTNIGDYSLESLDNNNSNQKIEKVNFLNGSIFYNVPNGNYKVKGSYLEGSDEKFLEKKKDWEKVYLDLEGVNFTNLEERFLNFLTICLIVFNIYLYLNTREKLPKKSILNFTFVLLTLKTFSSLRIDPSNNLLILFDFLVTRILFFSLIYYFLKNIYPPKFKKLKKFIWILLGIIYLYNVIISLIIYSPQFLVYLLEEHSTILSFISTLRKNIDLSRTLFLLFALAFFNQIKRIKIEALVNWFIIWGTYFLLEFFKELFPKAKNLIYFIDLMSIFCVYWALVFYNFKVYNKNVMRTILYTITITLSYISFFYFKSITEACTLIASIIILDFYANTINKIIYAGTKNIDIIYNRLCLVQDISTFEKLLSEEIRKQVNLKECLIKILIDKKEFLNFVTKETNDTNIIPNDLLKSDYYDFAYKIGFNKNKEIALVFIKEGENSLTIAEQNFLLELCNKIANIINKLRLEALYRELK